MDQVKIGSFLRELRKEKALTQEQLAEQFGVSGRTVSRWENGNNMPDISILIELADFYDVDIRELIDGERKSENMNEEMKDTLVKVAEYTNAEKDKLMKELSMMAAASAAFFIILGLIVIYNLTRLGSFFYEFAVICSCLGTVYSVMSIIKLRQVNDRISKEAHKKLVRNLLIAGIVVVLFSALSILWALGAIG